MLKYFDKFCDWCSHACGRFCDWSMWHSLKRKMRPLPKTSQFLKPDNVSYQLRLCLDPLRLGKKTGMILISDNKRSIGYIKGFFKSNDIRADRLMVVPFKTTEDKLFDLIKRHFTALETDYAVTGYQNDEPFYVFRIPNSKPKNSHRIPRGQPSKKSEGQKTKHINKGVHHERQH